MEIEVHYLRLLGLERVVEGDGIEVAGEDIGVGAGRVAAVGSGYEGLEVAAEGSRGRGEAEEVVQEFVLGELGQGLVELLEEKWLVDQPTASKK